MFWRRKKVEDNQKLTDEELKKIEEARIKKEIEEKYLKLNELPKSSLKDKEQILIKTLAQVELLVEKCKIEGLNNPEDWRRAGIPMKDILQYLLNLTKEVSAERMKEASKETGVKTIVQV